METTSLHLEISDADVRETLPKIKPRHVRLALTTLYLTACRASELKSIIGQNMTEQRYQNHPIVVFAVKTLKKRDEEYRMIALPLEEQYEPLSREVREYAKGRDPGRPVFPQVRQTLYNHVHQNFQKYNYRIENQGPVKAHWKQAAPHALRHARLTNLAEEYYFDEIDLSTFAGWELNTRTGFSSSMLKRYVHLQYRRYIEKLFREKQQ